MLFSATLLCAKFGETLPRDWLFRKAFPENHSRFRVLDSLPMALDEPLRPT